MPVHRPADIHTIKSYLQNIPYISQQSNFQMKFFPGNYWTPLSSATGYDEQAGKLSSLSPRWDCLRPCVSHHTIDYSSSYTPNAFSSQEPEEVVGAPPLFSVATIASFVHRSSRRRLCSLPKSQRASRCGSSPSSSSHHTINIKVVIKACTLCWTLETLTKRSPAHSLSKLHVSKTSRLLVASLYGTVNSGPLLLTAAAVNLFSLSVISSWLL